MRYIVIFSLLLLVTGCTQPATPAPEVIELKKKPAGIETLERKSETQIYDTETPVEIERVPEEAVAVAAVVKPKKPVAKTPEEIKAVAAVQEQKKKAVKKPKPKAKPKKAVVAAKKPKAQKIIIGEVEPVRLIPGDVIHKARIDTGAQTTSIHAEDIQQFERDGKKWVRFRLKNAKEGSVIEKPVSRIVQIKRHGKESQDRYVVKMRLILGERSQVVEVSLTDRGSFTYPILIGRNFLRDIYIVDVGSKMSSKPIEYKR